MTKAVIDKYGSAPPKLVSMGPSNGGGSGKLELFAPSHPQTVNQHVQDYNYRAKQDGYKKELQKYKESLTRTYIATAP